MFINEKKIRFFSFASTIASAFEISRLLSEEGLKISVRTVERVLAEQGFPRLPSRSRGRVQRGRPVKGAEIPEPSERVLLEELDGKRFSCSRLKQCCKKPYNNQYSHPERQD